MTLKLHWPFWLVLPASCVAPVIFALAIGAPTVRLSGVYLAIATIGLGEVLRALYLNVDLFGGALGLSGIPTVAETWEIYALLALAVLVLFLVAQSRIGRAMEAIRQDETAARVMGIDLFRYRMGALVAAAVLAGIAGALDAHSSSFIGPSQYGFEPAVTILSFALLGGIANPFAPVLGRLDPDAAARGAARRRRCAAHRQRRHHRRRRAVPAARHPAHPHASCGKRARQSRAA